MQCYKITDLLQYTDIKIQKDIVFMEYLILIKYHAFHSDPFVSFITLIFLHSSNNKHAVMCCCPSPVFLVMI